MYHILVSEIMLQQTQVERVLPFYTTFIKKFPTAHALARAPLSEILKNWQGLGYNRRAKMLQSAVKELGTIPLPSARRTDLPTLIALLEKLPGVGPYTARAIAAFAYNQEVIVIETNIRTAVTYHFFAKRKKVSDKEIEKVLQQVAPKGRSREWYSALMDYGAYLKRSGVNLNAKQSNYVKQKKFVGSNREARGAILRTLAADTFSRREVLLTVLGASRHAQMQGALAALQKEGLVVKDGGTYRLAR